ncbi:MAG: hypothetical protein RLZZ144_289 [Pseudomonadota bacterium]
MSVITRLFFALWCFMSVQTAFADSMQLGSMAKADFSREFSFGADVESLIGGQGNWLYFTGKDGVVTVSDVEGKRLMTLQAKDASGHPILKKPHSVATTASLIYVLDGESNQVAMFNHKGEYQASFGPGKGGLFSSGGGVEIKAAKAVAVYEGIVYVLDGGNNNIQMFGSNGVYLGVFGLRPSSKQGKNEEKVHLLDEPIDLQIDLRGQIYVLDVGDQLLKVYSLSGEYVRHLPKTGRLEAFAVAQDGVYVADAEKLFIQKYDFNDKPVYRFGSKGKDRAQFQTVSDLTVVKNREVIVSDDNKKMVTVFVADAGDALESIPKPLTQRFVQWEGMFAATATQLVSNGDDLIYGVDLNDKSIVRFKNGVADAHFKIKDLMPVALALDSAGGLWVLDDKKSRVVKVDDKGNVLPKAFGSSGSGAGQFSDPTDLAISSSGRIWVADGGNDRIQVFSGEGIFQNEIRKLDNPLVISVSPQEGLFVLEKRKVLIYTPKLELLATIDKNQENPAAKLDEPKDILATSDELMILDGNQVKVYSHAGKYLRAFSVKGKNRGELIEPISIARKDEATFLIAEQENKRIQTFSTQFKPVAPKQLTAEAEVHAIHLRWLSPALPYLKQYVIYRSKDENKGFVRSATSVSNEYIDRGLEAEGQYFYRVGVETVQGYEGQTSALASAVAKKYTPSLIVTPMIEATPWQLKISWEPIVSEYLSGYRIYQKEGDEFTLLVEAPSAVFVKTGLQPNSRYTFYIAALSKDGLESEKVAVNGMTAIFNKPPLEIEVIKLRNVFSNSYKIYEQDGVGIVRLTNNTNATMDGVQLSFVLKDFMDYATETSGMHLLPGQSIEVPLKAVFNNNILTVTEDSPVQAMLEASHFDNGKREFISKTMTVNVYDKHKLLWDERGRYAAFITPKDPPLVAFTRSIASQYKDVKDETQLASIIYHALGTLGLTYVQDPTNPYQVMSGNVSLVDYIQFPRETLFHKSGDCDDLTALYSAALESLGIETRVIEVPGHMFMMFNTGAVADIDGYTMDDMYVAYEDKLWIPVETTLLGNTFLKAWEKGAESYYKYLGKGLAVLDIHQAWTTYKPASLPDNKEKVSEVSKAAIEKKFPNEFLSMLKISSTTKTHRYQQLIESNPKDLDAHMQIGILVAKQGDTEEAMKYFNKVVELDPKNAAALNNKGNLLMMGDHYLEAQEAYRKAADASPDDPYVLISLTKAYRASNNLKEAKKAFDRALKIAPTIKKKYKTLTLELQNTL